MLHNAYEVTMNSRLHQIGTLKSTGASPRQIRTVLIQECVLLSLLPALFGAPVYLFHDYGIIMDSSQKACQTFSFRCHPSGRNHACKKNEALPAVFFHVWPFCRTGCKIHLCQKKAFRTSMISITCSILAFISFLNLETISGLSVEDRYFNRYRNVWDFGIELNSVSDQTRSQLTASIRQMDGVTSCIQYRRTLASASVSRDCLSRQAVQDTSFSNEGASNNQAENMVKLSVPILILDNESFSQYQTENPEQIVNPNSGIIAVNQYWDNQTSRRMSPVSLFKTDAPLTLELYSSDGKTPITVKTENFSSRLPKLTEEFPQGSLPLIFPSENSCGLPWE